MDRRQENTAQQTSHFLFQPAELSMNFGQRPMQCDFASTRAMECKIKLLKSAAKAREDISKRRNVVQRQLLKSLEDAEQKAIDALQNMVDDQLNLYDIQLQERATAGTQLAQHSHYLRGVIVRFDPRSDYETILSLGILELEDKTTSQLMRYNSNRSDVSHDENTYQDISSINSLKNPSSDCAIDRNTSEIMENDQMVSQMTEESNVYEFRPSFPGANEYNRDDNNSHSDSSEESRSDTGVGSSDDALYIHPVEFCQETQVTDVLYYLPKVNVAEDTCGDSFVDNYSTDESCDDDIANAYAAVIRDRKSSFSTLDLFGEGRPSYSSQNMGTEATLQGGEIPNDTKDDNTVVSTEIREYKTFHCINSTTLSDNVHDSWRIALLSDGRYVLISECDETMSLYDKNHVLTKTQTLKRPRTICTGKGDVIVTVHQDNHGQSLLVIEAKPNFLKITDSKRLDDLSLTVDINYKECKYYIGSFDFRVSIFDEDFQKKWVVDCGKGVEGLMTSLDYSPETGHLYTVATPGSMRAMTQKGTSSDALPVSAIAVRCHGDKAYLLCAQEETKIIEIWQTREMKQRPVIFLPNSTPIDFSISQDGKSLVVLVTKKGGIQAELYSIQTQSR